MVPNRATHHIYYSLINQKDSIKAVWENNSETRKVTDTSQNVMTTDIVPKITKDFTCN